ncbi:MAG: AAA family ATPase [Actinomycetota bacterium]|nr:AAA family ATPase [Actinomycetota bacterium]
MSERTAPEGATVYRDDDGRRYWREGSQVVYIDPPPTSSNGTKITGDCGTKITGDCQCSLEPPHHIIEHEAWKRWNEARAGCPVCWCGSGQVHFHDRRGRAIHSGEEGLENRNGDRSLATSGGDERDESGLEFLTAAQLAAEVDNAPPVGFLFRPVWPADAYGVAAAEHKAGKTWAGLDMVVSAASGTPWLGVYPVERAGPVLVFLGEGGKRKMLRRLRAICASRGLVFEELPIILCPRSPHLTSLVHVGRIADEVARLRPVLVVIDPLYLAARGAKSALLVDMGAHLENVQAVVQAHGAALCVIHHWNQTGTGRGSERMSGAGPAEWGRVLVSAKVEHRHTDEPSMATTVTLALQFEGDEIPHTELRIRRKVWADDPDDLASPMHYEVERLEAKSLGVSPVGDIRPATARVLAVLTAASTGITVSEIGDDLATDATGLKPLKARTIQASLKELEEAKLAECEHLGGRAYVWRALGAAEEAGNGL